MNPAAELNLLLVASDLLDHESGTLYQITLNLLPLYPRSDPDSKLTSLLQLVNNWPPSELSAPLIQRQSRFCARYKCFTLHYIHNAIVDSLTCINDALSSEASVNTSI